MSQPQTDRPPPQPIYIFRGHTSPIHSIRFTHPNSRLISGDADGWLVIWDVAIRRPTAVWRAHTSVVLGIETWSEGRLITHGRDGNVCVWKMGRGDEVGMSMVLPVEKPLEHRREPWLLHTLKASSLTFCSMSICENRSRPSSSLDSDLLVALPGGTDGTVEIYQLPTENQVGLIPAPSTAAGKGGMVMSLKILYHSAGQLLVIVGYESGRTCLYKRVSEAGRWGTVYSARIHEQPVLSLDASPSLDYYLTSGADAVISKHLLSPHTTAAEPLKVIQSKHAGQQGLQIRSDGKIFATGGWDGRARVYSCKTMKELAVLKWHKEGCYAIAFAQIEPDLEKDTASEGTGTEVAKSNGQLMPRVAQARHLAAQSTHWLALGSKDGKISLWEVY